MKYRFIDFGPHLWLLVPLVLDQHLDQLVVHDLHVNLKQFDSTNHLYDWPKAGQYLVFMERFCEQLSVPFQDAGVVGKLVQLVDVILVRIRPDTHICTLDNSVCVSVC